MRVKIVTILITIILCLTNSLQILASDKKM